MNEFPLWQDLTVDHTISDVNNDIIFDNISFVYPARSDVLVLRNLSLIVRAGETTALVGWSGSGKNSLPM